MQGLWFCAESVMERVGSGVGAERRQLPECSQDELQVVAMHIGNSGWIENGEGDGVKVSVPPINI